MTPGYMTLTLGPRKNPQRKVAFLLEKTAFTGFYSIFEQRPLNSSDDQRVFGQPIYQHVCRDIVHLLVKKINEFVFEYFIHYILSY